jgi:hypothetical protein
MTNHARSVLTPQSRFKKGKVLCPVCHHTHGWHCSVTEDESLALCSCVWSDKKAKDGRHIHVLKHDGFREQKQSAVSAMPIRECGNAEKQKARIAHCDAVYRYLFDMCLKLTPEHGDGLLEKRTLPDVVIAAKLYASTPSENQAAEICNELSERFDLRGVAGFYRNDDNEWRMNIRQGLFIPVRDSQGRIAACQIRCDEGEIRYLWFSSNEMRDGASSGAPMHFAKPDLVKQTGIALITEGVLKADIIAEYEQSAVIGLAGVSSFNSETIGGELKDALPDLRNITIVFDADWREKREVKKALLRLITALRQEGLMVNVREWDLSLGKGYDDFLINRERATEQ